MDRPHREFDEPQWRTFESALRREMRCGVLRWAERHAPNEMTLGQLRLLVSLAGGAVSRVFDDCKYPDGRRWPEFESPPDATPASQ